MKKRLNTNSIMNELRGNSGFFQPKEDAATAVYEAEPEADTMPPRHQDTAIPCHRDTIEAIRKAVREIGKEAATHRFTSVEKETLMDVVFRYKKQGITTSENEITRIAINCLLSDFQQQGASSFLAQVIKQYLRQNSN